MIDRPRGAPRPTWALVALLLAAAACRNGRATADAGSEADPGGPGASLEGWVLTSRALEGWLRAQRGLAALPVRSPDAGPPSRAEAVARARAERAVLADAGLTPDDLDKVEDVVAVFVAERNVERLAGGVAASQFKGALVELSVEQRLKAEEAFAELQARAAPSPLPALENRFGPDALQLLLEHETELTRAWDAALEGRERPSRGP